MDTKRKSYRELNKQMDEEFDAKIFVKHEFSEAYKGKREKLITSVDNQDAGRVKRQKGITKAAVPAAAVIICTTSVFAASQLNKSKIADERVGDYQVDLTFYKDSDETNVREAENSIDSETNLKENLTAVEERYIKMNMNYLPDGINNLGPNYGGDEYGGELGHITIRVFDMNDVDNKVQFESYSVRDVNHLEINGNDAILIEAYDEVYNLLGNEIYPGSHSKNLYIYYKEAEAVVDLWATTGIPNDELVKIAENIDFSEGTADDCTHFELWTDMTSDRATLVGTSEPVTTINKKYVDIYGIGDSFNSLAENKVDEKSGSITGHYLNYEVKDIRISDKLEAFGFTWLDEEDIKTSVDENGNVLPDRLLYIKNGDGVFTLSNVVEDKTVDMKVVYVTLDITNNSSQDYEDIILLLNLTSLKEEGENYTICDYKTGLTLDEQDAPYDGVYHTSKLSRDGAIYDDFSTYERKNHIDIKSGETRTIHLAYCVDADDIDNLYITPDIFGGQFEFREAEPEGNYQYIKMAR